MNPNEGDTRGIAVCAFPGTHDIKDSIRRHTEYIDKAKELGADLVVFPEISLQGYPPRIPGSVANTMRNGEHIPDSPNVAAIIGHASERSIHVIFGVNEATDVPGIVHNTVVLAGPGGYVGSFRKCHLSLREQEFWCNGDDWPVFDTPIGKIGMMICYDLMWPEAARELTLRGAEIIVISKAWPKGDMYDSHQRILECARAIENHRWIVSTNYAGELDGNLYPGAGRVIDPLGRVLMETGPEPGVFLCDIEVGSGIIEAMTAYYGPRLLRDRQPHTYRALRTAG